MGKTLLAQRLQTPVVQSDYNKLQCMSDIRQGESNQSINTSRATHNGTTGIELCSLSIANFANAADRGQWISPQIRFKL